MVQRPTRCLTIGGSDSGGAAGVQADLRAWAQLRVYGMSALTVVTAQDSTAVHAAVFLTPEQVRAQIDAVRADYGADGIKTGFIGRADLIAAIAGALPAGVPLVVDPVLVNHRGEAMFGPDVTVAYRKLLLPRATIVTPNRREAALLSGLPVRDPREAAAAAAKLGGEGGTAVLIKSIPDGEELVDMLIDGVESRQFRHPRRETTNTHGSGDTLSAVLCAELARGAKVETAVVAAITFTARAIWHGADWELGAGHGPVGWG